MKKLLLTSTLVCATVAASFGQGTLVFGNNFGKTTWRAPIYGPEPGNPSLVIQGAGTASTPTAGTVQYTGPLLAGTGFDIAFYGGPTSATGVGAGLQLLTIETSFSTTAALAGFTTSTITLTDPNVAAGASENYQVFAWGNLGGTVNTLAAAQADWALGEIAYGSSPINTTTAGLGGGTVFGPNTTFASFNITQSTPEPATMALVGLGAAGMLLIRRKK
jgi:hypothetical protein